MRPATLAQRTRVIETCAEVLFDTARQAGESWTKHLGEPPVTNDTPLGPTPETAAHKIDAARAKTALDRAHDLTIPAGAVPELTQQREPLGRSL